MRPVGIICSFLLEYPFLPKTTYPNLKQIRYDGFSFLWVSFELSLVPVMCNECSSDLIEDDKDNNAPQRDVMKASRDDECTVDEDFKEIVWTGDIFKPSSLWNAMLVTADLACKKMAQFVFNSCRKKHIIELIMYD